MRVCKSSKKAKFYSQESYFTLSHPVPKREDQLGMERRGGGKGVISSRDCWGKNIILASPVYALVWFRTHRERAGDISKVSQIGEARIHDCTILKWGLMEFLYIDPQYCLVWKSNVPAVLCVSVCNFSVFEVKPFTSSTISQPKSKGKGTTQNK